uniref:Transmembrane protein 174 n=1 Tax=Lepisosteus oculatus TaxID=7918 RepID=W5MYZ2_LEPOC
NRNNNSEDFSVNVFSVSPYRPNRSDNEVTDGDKAGATLLFSGVFLGLVGLTFTVMGWISYDSSKDFEWTQLLGPILLSVGVTFVLIGVCKFKMLTCKLCKQGEDVFPEADQGPCGQSFVFSGINQPITFHGATVVQYIPPPNATLTQDGIVTNHSPTANPLNGVCGTAICPPQYYTMYPLDNLSFVGDDHSPVSQGVDSSDSRSHESGERKDRKTASEEALDSAAPPSYDDIFPAPL